LELRSSLCATIEKNHLTTAQIHTAEIFKHCLSLSVPTQLTRHAEREVVESSVAQPSLNSPGRLSDDRRVDADLRPITQNSLKRRGEGFLFIVKCILVGIKI
jgi:hypothetical protein